MHQAESSLTLSCLWTGLSFPVALHPASQRRSYLPLRTGQCSRPDGTFTLLLVRTFRRTFPRHFVLGYDRCCPSGDCRTWPVLVLPVFTVPLFTRQTPPKAETIQAKNPSERPRHGKLTA